MNNFAEQVKDKFYQFEYLNIQNQRIALVRIVHLWYQIALPASITFFGLIVRNQTNISLIWVGGIVAVAFIWFVRFFSTRHLDRAIVNLYPRIIALELILDYYFFRNYLRGLGDKEDGIVEKCESIKTDDISELWKKVRKEFESYKFPFKGRGYDWLFWVSCFLTAFFLLYPLGYSILCMLLKLAPR